MSLIAIITAIIAAVPSIIGVASIIVKFTATKRDDEFLAGSIKVAEALSLAKTTPAVVRTDLTEEELAELTLNADDASARSKYRRPTTARGRLDEPLL